MYICYVCIIYIYIYKIGIERACYTEIAVSLLSGKDPGIVD
jgi:hypothetical protein